MSSNKEKNMETVVEDSDEAVDVISAHPELTELIHENPTLAEKINKDPELAGVLSKLTIHQSVRYSGPVPHPDLMRGFNQIIPDGAERILAMAEADAEHQRYMQKEILKARRIEVARGQHFGLTIGLAALTVGVIAIYFGAEWAGGIIGSGGVIGLVAPFVLAHKGK